jgi:hypothetical protein
MTATPDQIIAHIGLLRAVDRLLRDADEVRAKKESLERLISAPNSERESDREGATA